MSKNIKKNSESKKNIKKITSKTEKKPEKIIKKSKKVEEEFEEESDSLEDFDFEEEVEEKNKVERQIKGEKESDKIEVDKEVIDKEINKTISGKVKEEPKKAVPAIKKTRKETVIDSILDAHSKLDIPESERLTYAQLKATKINLLEKKLGDLTEKMVVKVINPESKVDTTNTAISDESCAMLLLNFNLLFTSFIENAAVSGRQNPVTAKYCPNLDGLTVRIQKPEKEKALKECLKAIIEKHGEQLKPYVNPILMYISFMLFTIQEQVIDNASKNLEEPII